MTAAPQTTFPSKKAGVAEFAVVDVQTGSRLRTTYSLHRAENALSNAVLVGHHGICHTREQFLPLIAALNDAGIPVVMVDQQSEDAGFFRNALGLRQYRKGLAAAVRQFAKEHPDLSVGGYVLHSMGALAGQLMQDEDGNLRRPTVLMAPIPDRGARSITKKLFLNDPRTYLQAVFRLDIHWLARTLKQVRELFFDSTTEEKTVEDTRDQLKHASFWLYCQLVLRGFWPFKLVPDDGLPKLLLTSDTDGIFPPDEYEPTKQQYEILEEEAIPGGHDFFIEHAVDTAKVIADFYQRRVLKMSGEERRIDSPHAHPRPPVDADAVRKETTIETEE